MQKIRWSLTKPLYSSIFIKSLPPYFLAHFTVSTAAACVFSHSLSSLVTSNNFSILIIGTPSLGWVRTGDVEMLSLWLQAILFGARGGLRSGEEHQGVISSPCSVALPPARLLRTGGVCAHRAVFLTLQLCRMQAQAGPTALSSYTPPPLMFCG